jgi:hypothetical protein
MDMVAILRSAHMGTALGMALGLLAAFACTCAASDKAANPERRWKPVPDEVYLQEIGERVTTDQPVTSVAVVDKEVYAVVGGKLMALRSGALEPVADAPAGITRMKALAGELWASTADATYRLKGRAWQTVASQPFVDFCMHLGAVHAATPDDVFRFDGTTFKNLRPETGYLSSNSTLLMEDFTQVIADPIRLGPIERIASYSGTLYMMGGGRVSLLEGVTFVPEPIDWGIMPSPNVRDMIAIGSRLCLATDRGVGVLRGMALTTLRGEDGLPYEDTSCLAEGFDAELWIGTTRGAIRQTGKEFHYFGAENWLPADQVNAIAVADHDVYIATNGGLAIIHYEPYTLAKKAAFYERRLDEWGFKRMGFVHKLWWSNEENGWLREISDNDGGHTAHYLAAMCYKYAATKDETARKEALDAFRAMVWLDDITPKPGFIARAIWSVQGDKGRRSERGSGGLPAKWYPTPDGLWLWKGDTSSDEVNAHMYSVSLFHDLVARGSEKDRARDHIARIATHIIENGWVLRDMDGKPTRWGRWDPDYLLKPYGFEARGLNGMEAQTYMITAMALTGDPKFKAGLDQLLKWRYHTYTVRQKLTFPPDAVVPWDDELAFRCYLPLLSYATDPDLRSIYLRSLERHWEVMRMQKLPYFNFIYGALTGNDCEAPEAVRNLREWPMDLVNHTFRNSHRTDLRPEPGYVPYGGGIKAISPRETTAMWGSRSAIVLDGGSGGKGVTPPIGWLEDYWMGRYYGFIEAPTTRDPKLLRPDPMPKLPRVAEPYKGPARPQ